MRKKKHTNRKKNTLKYNLFIRHNETTSERRNKVTLKKICVEFNLSPFVTCMWEIMTKELVSENQTDCDHKNRPFLNP